MTENELLENKKIECISYNGNDFYYMNDSDVFPFAYRVADKIDGKLRTFDEAEKIMSALSYCYVNKMRCRIWYGDRQTGKSWIEDIDTTGFIKRSGGRLKVPLLVYNSRSQCGHEIMTHVIVRIDCIQNQSTLYLHRNFHVPPLVVVHSVKDGYQVENGRTGRTCAVFKTRRQAERYIEFMKGERYSK